MPNTDKLKLVLSENLRRYMKKSGINTADLSRSLGYSFTTVSDWVNGRKYPRMDKVQAMADYFGIMKSDLTEEKPFSPEHEREIRREDLMAAFWGGEKDLSPEDMDEMWTDVENFAAFVVQQKRKEKQK